MLRRFIRSIMMLGAVSLISPIPGATAEEQMAANAKKLLETKVCEGCDLRGANLEKADLRGANLNTANLQGANLKEANLENADLSGADMQQADLQKANLKDAMLIGATLYQANLEGADITGIDPASLKELMEKPVSDIPQGADRGVLR
ncbi:MAG: pentapeptide repeat-containing protein [Gammaproteobacteria bacterium]|nr:pentapeptide repeat-containing protein [Gammaproteobacteria bacterium]